MKEKSDMDYLADILKSMNWDMTSRMNDDHTEVVITLKKV